MTVTERLARQAERRTKTRWLVLAAVAVGLWRGLRWLATHLAVTAALALVLLTWWAINRGLWPWLLLATGCLVVALGGWAEARPDGWRRLELAARARWRCRRYARRWEDAMAGAELTRAGMVPALQSVRILAADPGTDVLRVAMADGQLLLDWRKVQSRLRGPFGARRVRVQPVAGRPDLLDLYVSRQQPATPVPDRTRRPADTAVTESLAGEEQDVDTTTPDDTARQPRGAFPRTPGGRP